MSKTTNAPPGSAPPGCYPRIRVYRQKGPGYWACLYFADGGIEAVQSPQIYGFPTKEEARAEALRRCADNAAGELQPPQNNPK
jgi:hypothetical protein